MTQGQRDLYDANARQLAATFSGCGVRATTGAEELQALDIADNVGHVETSSKHVVIAAYVSWVRRCLRPAQSEEQAQSPQQEEEQEKKAELWQAFFCAQEQQWCFEHGGSGKTTWERPPEDCDVVWETPIVPEPWVVDEDDSGELSFWNEFYVEDGKQVGKRQVEVPTELPPCDWPYVARRGFDGSWEYVHVDEPKDVDRNIVPKAPEGWAVDWSGSQQSWFWRNCATGEATLTPPEKSVWRRVPVRVSCGSSRWQASLRVEQC